MAAYLPAFTANGTMRLANGTPIWSNQPVAVWLSRGRVGNKTQPGEPRITHQVATSLANWAPVNGWSGNPPVFDYSQANSIQITGLLAGVYKFNTVYGGVMWAGTPEAHVRWDCCQFVSTAPVPTPSFPLGRADGFTTTFDIYRPFGAAAPLSVGLAGVFYSDIPAGRGGYSGGNYALWDAFLAVAPGVDVRDGSSRAAGLDDISFADGDQVNVPSGAGSTKYVVVRVVNSKDLTGNLFKLVYLCRDQPHWPGP